MNKIVIHVVLCHFLIIYTQGNADTTTNIPSLIDPDAQRLQRRHALKPSSVLAFKEDSNFHIWFCRARLVVCASLYGSNYVVTKMLQVILCWP